MNVSLQKQSVSVKVISMYTRPLGIIGQRYRDKYHLYVDSTYMLKNLEHCIADIRLWITQNLLRLNDNKQILFNWLHYIVLNP